MGTRIQNVQETEYKGHHFRSKLEAATAQMLDALHLPYRYEERKIILQEGFKSPFQKDKVRSITYTPDFEVGALMIECKGFETPEWKIKKKMVFKYLMENEPETLFYQIHDSKRQLLEALDNHWQYLGFSIQVTSKASKKNPQIIRIYESVKDALRDLGIKKPIGAVLRSLTGTSEWVYGYNWKLIGTEESNELLKQ